MGERKKIIRTYLLLIIGIAAFAVGTGIQIANRDVPYANAYYSLGFVYSLMGIPPIAWFLAKIIKISSKSLCICIGTTVLISTTMLFIVGFYPTLFGNLWTLLLERIILPDILGMSISIFYSRFL